jgi:hypothetical protein
VIRAALVALVSLAALSVVGGCRGGASDAAPPCGAVAARFIELAKAELARATSDAATTRAVAAQLPAMRDSLAQACTEGNWSSATRKCLVRANDPPGFEACEQQLSDEQRRYLDRATRGTLEPR